MFIVYTYVHVFNGSTARMARKAQTRGLSEIPYSRGVWGGWGALAGARVKQDQAHLEIVMVIMELLCNYRHPDARARCSCTWAGSDCTAKIIKLSCAGKIGRKHHGLFLEGQKNVKSWHAWNMEKNLEFSVFPLYSFNDLVQFIPASKKNCFQANPFYLRFCSAAEFSVVGVSRVIYLYWKCGWALYNSHVGTFMNE